jgi:hypothetical protein
MQHFVSQLGPLLSWLQRHPPHVNVVTGPRRRCRRCAADGVTVTVVGPDDEIERNAPGGWAQPRYQRRAEDSWQHNATEVADVTTRALSTVGAGLLLVAGDVRAVQLLEDRLRGTTRTPASRSAMCPAAGSPTARRATVAELVAAHAEQRTAALLGQFDAERGPHGRAAWPRRWMRWPKAGVDTLIVVDDPGDDRGVVRPGPAGVADPTWDGRMACARATSSTSRCGQHC